MDMEKKINEMNSISPAVGFVTIVHHFSDRGG